MATNQSPEFIAAQKKYLSALTDEEKIYWLEEMIRNAPKHKGAEALRAELRKRYKKLKEKIEFKKLKKKKSGKKEGIKKEDMQAVIIGFTNSGKSSLLSCLTNANPLISPIEFTTKEPIVGTLVYNGANIQIIDMPAINFENFDYSIANVTDLLIIVIINPKEIQEIESYLTKSKAKRLIVLNKIDLLSKEELRKYTSFLQSKKYNFIAVSCKTLEGINELKEKIFLSFEKIRIYTKEPGKEPSKDPIILNVGSNVKDVAEKIRNGLSLSIKEARVTGPSSKFPNQLVSLDHELKDKDIIEFKFK
ncbi:MAG: GTPase [Candidatus Pacearchaeota archaeon]